MSLKSFIDYLEIEKKYSPNTIQAYRNDLNVFGKYLVNEHDVNKAINCNYSHIRSWIVDLVNKGISNRSVNRKITSLNSYFKFMLKIDLLNVLLWTKSSMLIKPHPNKHRTSSRCQHFKHYNNSCDKTEHTVFLSTYNISSKYGAYGVHLHERISLRIVQLDYVHLGCIQKQFS